MQVSNKVTSARLTFFFPPMIIRDFFFPLHVPIRCTSAIADVPLYASSCLPPPPEHAARPLIGGNQQEEASDRESCQRRTNKLRESAAAAAAALSSPDHSSAPVSLSEPLGFLAK